MVFLWKKWICALVSLILLLGIAVPASAQEHLSVSAAAAVVLCADNGQVLYAKNAEEERAMASTTKIMTALLTLEEAQRSDRVITVSPEAAAVEGSSMYLNAGDQITLRGLAAGMLIVSGNDAAFCAAQAIAGSQEAFAARMNEKAQALNLEHTQFVTASGLDADGHYSTALDLAKLAAAALENAEFAEICGQKTYSVDFISPQRTQEYTNHNKLLRMYRGCIGVKTGYTKKAGRCLVSAAERDGVRLVAVTLNAPDDWNDHRNMLDYGFAQVSAVQLDERETTLTVEAVGGTVGQVTVRGGNGGKVIVNAADQARVKRIVELPRFVYAPLMQGVRLGRVVYYLDGKELGSVLLQTDQTLEQLQEKRGWLTRLKQFFCQRFG